MISKKLLFLEPFYGGSHKDFADGWIQYSRHCIDLYTLPATFWKWRLRSAAMYFINEIKKPGSYEGIICSGMMSISDLKSYWGRCCPPICLYMHESQLSYPLPKSSKVNHHGIHIDLSNCLAADSLIFNSHTHLKTFLNHIPLYMNRIPEYAPDWIIKTISDKAHVLYPGCRFPGKPCTTLPNMTDPPLIIWNHRWEFDKAPEEFFQALMQMDKEGLKFSLALLGECSQDVPKPFIFARQRWENRIVQYGFLPKEEYINWLSKGNLVISTAIQENFGISVVEAIYYGSYPLLPNRLSYPEILASHFHTECLYNDYEELLIKLRNFLQNPGDCLSTRNSLAQFVAKYSWENVVDSYDNLFY